MMTIEQRDNLLALADELRSGRHKQAQGALFVVDARSSDTYKCCLGVACHMIDPSWVDHVGDEGTEIFDVADEYAAGRVSGVAHGPLTTMFWAPSVDTHPEASELPDDAQYHYGINEIGKVWVDPDVYEAIAEADGPGDIPMALHMAIVREDPSLISMNDHGATFRQIADAITYVIANPETFRFLGPDDDMYTGEAPAWPEWAMITPA